MNNISILACSLFLAVAACSKGPKADPCDATAVAALASSSGKQVALTGCTFHGQGNDIVAFSDATGKAPSIDCKLKGGESKLTEFRHAAMKLDMAKLKLDVQGTSGKDGLTDCEVSPHE
jgi:hypothetical protein